MDGVIRFGSTEKNRLTVTYDDARTDEEAIVRALVAGGVNVPGQSTPVPQPPITMSEQPVTVPEQPITYR